MPMTTKEKFDQLKELELKAKTKKELGSIQLEFDQLATADPDGFEDAFIESAKQTLKAVKQLKVKEQIKEMQEIVSMSFIAKTYFSKTKSWMSQRINELNVNGKPAQFTPEEINTLNEAFKDISKKVGEFRISY
jgi:hypothetical protein